MTWNIASLVRLFSLAAAAAVLGTSPPIASGMTKAELIDAIAAEAGLSKSDTKRALDGFIAATTKALKKGGSIALQDFGALRVTPRLASADGCSWEGAVDFYAGSAFRLGYAQAIDIKGGQCPEGGLDGEVLTDDGLLEGMIAEADLDPESATAAYTALLDIVVRRVNAGEKVDLGEDFGAFFEETEVRVTGTPRKKAAPKKKAAPDAQDTAEDEVVPTVDITLAVHGVDDNTLRQLLSAARAAARNARNPRGAKEITISPAKTKVRFKAGAELAQKVNKTK